MKRLLVAALLGCLAACGGSSESTSGVGEEPITEAKLAIEGNESLPEAELSGLGVRQISGKKQFMAVSDRSLSLITFDLDGNKPKSVKQHDLSKVFADRADPQWEGVAGDGDGRVFILDELGAIHVLDSKLEKMIHRINIDIPKKHPLHDSWDNDENSRAEGFVLLSNGHILIAKEKGPAALIELAEEGSEPKGYTPELALGKKKFDLPRGEESTFVPVAFWELKTDAQRFVGDISELAVEDDGRLVLLSDQSRVIARVERELTPDEAKIDVKNVFQLPREIEKPEGLIFSDGKPLVVVDKGDASNGFFALGKL